MTGVTRWNKAVTPAGSDGWNLTPNLGTALDTANVIVPVSSAAERDALTPPQGKYPGMVISRKDIVGAPLERWDGNKWSATDVPWTNVPLAQGFNYVTSGGWSGMQYAVRSGWVIVNGAVTRDTAWSDGITCGVIPASIAPAVRIQGTNNAYISGQNVSLAAGSVATSFHITWPLF